MSDTISPRYRRHRVTVRKDGSFWAPTDAGRVRVGGQAPTFSVVGPYARSLGPEVAAVFEGWGTRFYPSQLDELELFLARDERGRFACRTISISKPRQNGKSFSARKYAIWMAAGEGKAVLYSAHDGRTVRKMFKLVKDEVLGTDELRLALDGGEAGVYSSKGSEGVYFSNGGMVEFQTRTSDGGLGTTYDVIVIDEAQQLTYDQLDAIKPTTIASESGDPQMIYVGTPPKPTEPGEVFGDQHEAAHAGAAGSAWWLEWAVGQVPDMSDPGAVMELAWRHNPAMGYRIREDVMADAIDSYRRRPDSFARQYLGWWSPVRRARRAIPADVWATSAIGEIGRRYQGQVAFGVKFSPDGSRYALAGCKLKRDRSRAAVELVEVGSTAAGTRPLARALSDRAGRACAVAVDGQAGAPALCENLSELEAPRGYVLRPTASDVISSAQGLADALADGTCAHATRGQELLDESASRATVRRIGTKGGWGFDGSIEMEACALALWAARTSRRVPGRRQRVL